MVKVTRGVDLKEYSLSMRHLYENEICFGVTHSLQGGWFGQFHLEDQ